MRRGVFALLCLLAWLPAARGADPAVVSGMVVDGESGEPVIGCVVRAKGAFTSTDREGRFAIRPGTGADSVSFRYMGYAPLSLPVGADFSCVMLRPKTMVLRDVIVEAPDIYARGDTLVFNVSRYANAKDNAIIDVIKRLPGIKVRDDGTIEYQGKPINKFYLDGNDFMDGQYGLATNNISHKDVKSVEVMERHQPVKALEGIEFPEEAGINLKLKEDARSRWVGVAQASAGVQPALFGGSVFAMRMSPRVQNMLTLKADNTGWNPAGEIREHDPEMGFTGDYESSAWREYISADAAGAPVAEKRSRDNLSWLANAIAAWKAGDTSMRLKVNYMADRLDYSSGVTTDYLSSQIPQFVQRNAQRTQSHDLSALFASETNKREYYLKDRLTVEGRWGCSNSAITGSTDVMQRVGRRTLSAKNDLRLVRRSERRLFTLTSRNSVAHRPDRLTVGGREKAAQAVGTTDLRSTSETRLGRLTRFWKYYLTAGADLNYHRMKSTLTGLGQYDNSGVHEAFLAELQASPQVDYERGGWRLSLRLPLKWLHNSAGRRHDCLNAAPRMSVRRQVSARSELTGNVAYRLGSPQAWFNIGVPVLSDYRNLLIASNPDKSVHEVSGSVGYSYRNPVKAFFANLTASYSYRRSALMMNQLFTGDFIITTYANRITDNGTWYAKGGVSKGLGHSRMVIGVDSDLTFSSVSSMRDNAVIPYRQTAAGVKPYLKGSILRWLSVNYDGEAGYRRAWSCQSNQSSLSAHNTLFATIIPCEKLQFTAGLEQMLTRFGKSNRANLMLVDASAVWQVGGKTRLSLVAANLLNNRNYEYVTYGTLSRSEHYFRLRSRSIIASLQCRF